MNKDYQKEYLALYNKCLDPNSLSDTLLKEFQQWKKFAQLHEEKWISNAQVHIDRHFILKIICIFHTNAYPIIFDYDRGVGGVFIKSARFNHSCSPNSEVSEYSHSGEQQIRATSKIKKGEEICINYILVMKNKKERQDHLKEFWGFICSCERCQDEEVTNDDKTYKKFQKLQEEAEEYVKNLVTMENNISNRLDLFEKAISCIRQMYILAENKKAPKCFIMNFITKEWFDLEVNRYRFAKILVSDAGKKEFVGKMEYFK